MGFLVVFEGPGLFRDNDCQGPICLDLFLLDFGGPGGGFGGPGGAFFSTGSSSGLPLLLPVLKPPPGPPKPPPGPPKPPPGQLEMRTIRNELTVVFFLMYQPYSGLVSNCPGV